MGNLFHVNNDGSVSQPFPRKVIGNIDWTDYQQYRAIEKFLTLQTIAFCICLLSVAGWIILLIFRIRHGYWPLFGIKAIENTTDKIKIYCGHKNKLGLYTGSRRITRAKYTAILQLPTQDYPTYILEYGKKYCVYNYTQRKILFKGAEDIKYLGDNVVSVQIKGNIAKYSLIGMCIE